RATICHLSGSADFPWLNGVVVIEGNLAPCFDQLLDRGLYIARLVDSTAHDDHLFSVPLEGRPECCQRLIQHGALKGRLEPGVASVDGHIHMGDLAMAAPGDAADLVLALACQLMCARG